MSSISALNSLLASSSATTTPTVDISAILAASVGATTPGIDVAAAVSAALYADRASERIWQAELATLSGQTAALTAIQTATKALTTDMTSLNTLTGPLSARTVVSSNAGAVTATAASGTVTGNHTVSVTNLASTASWYSDLSASPTATLPASSFVITTAAGPSASFTVGSGINTLKDVAAAVNANKTLGVTASVVSDSTGARLAIISTASGSAADFSITSGPTTAASWSSPPVPSASTTLGADSFTLKVGSTTTTITVADGETFGQLATDINSQSLGVTASVVNDARGYHLQIVSGDGTTPFTISEPAFGYSQAAAGLNASLSVDGVPISSSSNNVSGAINGVTLHLLSPTPIAAPTNLSIASDSTKVSTAISKFVDDYNTAIGLVNAQFSFSGSSQGVLGSDPTVRALQNSLLQVLNYVNTPATGSTTVSTLSALGITTGSDGALTIDDTALSNALSNNASDVQNFFQGASLNGFASSLNTQLGNFTNPGTGSFTVDLNSISKTSGDLTQHINDFESIYIANQKIRLTAMYSQAEIALQQLPTQMAQIQAQLGLNKSGS